jgi:hypothetical protein
MIETICFCFSFLFTEVLLRGTIAHAQMSVKASQLKETKVKLKQAIFDAICEVVQEPSMSGQQKRCQNSKGFSREDLILKLCELAGFQLEVRNEEYKLVS